MAERSRLHVGLTHLGLLAVLLGACRPSPAARAADAVRSWIAAVEADDPEAAYALLGRNARRGADYKGFVERWRGDRAEILANARELGKRLSEGPPELVPEVIASPLRAPLRLEADDHGAPAWRLDRAPTTATSAAHGPEEALAAWVEGLRQAQPVLRGLSSGLRRQAERDLETHLAQLKAVPQVSVNGDVATAVYPSGLRVRLAVEQGEWRVIGLDD